MTVPSSGLELDRPKKPPTTQAAETPADPSGWYPERQKDHRWLSALMKRIATGVVVVVALVVAWRVVKGSALPAPLAALVNGAQRMGRGEAVNDDEGIACFSGADGEYITYDDDKGSANIVTSPAQVPAKYRSKARCVYMKPQN